MAQDITEPGSESARLLPDPRNEVAALLEIDAGELGEDDDLFELGLDSLTVIRLASGWRHRGYPVSFEDLAVEPTIRSWRGVVDAIAATGAAPRPDDVDVAAPGAGTPFPLAPMQHAYWVGRQDGQPFGGVGSHFSLEFDGRDVDPRRLQRAFDALVARHPMLRVRFTADGMQRIEDATGLPTVAVRDLREGSDIGGDVPARLAELREHITHRRFDVSRGEVVELGLTLLPGGATRLHVDLDMMAADALSMSVLLGDLARFYLGAPPEPLDHEFRTFLAERDAGTAGADRAERRERDAQWWGERLADLPSPPELPVLPGAGRPGVPARMGRHHHLVSPEHSAALTAAARRRGLTPAAALATAFAEVVAAWSGSPRFLLNLPLFEREPLHPDVEKLVGDFTGSVLLDVDMGGEQALVVRAREVQSRLHAVVGHGAYGGVDVLRDLARRSGEPVLAPVVYTSAVGLGEMYDDDVRSSFGDAVWVGSQNPQVWLDAQVREQDGGLLLNWDVREDVLGDIVPAQMFAANRDLVLRLAGGDERVWDTSVGALLPDRAVAVRERVNATAAAVPRQALHAAFFAAARTDPGRPAVLGEPGRTGDALTYGELADRALRLAARLAGHGVRPGDAVAISLPRGTDQVVAVLGTLATGATYVPIGLDQPPLRRARILERAEAKAMLAEPGAEAEVPVLSPRDLGEQPLPGPLPVSPDDAAYVLFTSGSTGEPKGVEVSHAAAANTIAAIGARFGVGAGDRTLLVSALEFDLSVYDLFAPLSVGGAVVPLADDERRDPVRWWELVRRHRVSVWNTVPVLLDMLLAAAPADPGDSLRLVLLGGDWVSPELPGRLRAVVPGARFVALGGMTEAAIHSTVQEVPGAPDPDWRAVPWGVPLAGVRCRVVDGRGRDRPDLVTGELWVGGASVARGYRGDPERTADRFVTRDGVRWYRTGNLARYLPDGTLDFLGRADHQVKVRGHRIELGEIESALETHPAVRRAVAVVIGTASSARLAALVEATAPVSAQELRDRQTDLLPPAMICETVEARDALPLTSNGKPDRAAVARLLAAAGPALAEGEPPRGPVEQRLAGVWAELLDVPAVHRTDSFFTLGGDSLLATRLVTRLAADGIAGARLGALFGSPRLADFAATLELAKPATVAPQGTRIVPDLTNRHEPFPGTDVQAAYWLGRDAAFTLGGVGTWQYAEFDGADVDIPRLERAWDRLVARHEMLRAVLDPDGRHRILRDVPPTRIAVRDVSGDGVDAGERACAELRAECSHRLLDLTNWPLHELRAVRYTGADGESRTRVAIGLDYILFDALSIMTLFTELDRIYADPAAHLEPITLSFRDYVLQVAPEPAAVERAQEHWRGRLAELPEPPQLPLRIDPADLQRPRFTRRRRDLPAERWSELVRRARAEGLTPSTVLLAAYAEVLGAWSGSSALTVTLTLFDRRPVHDDVFRVLGDFTSLTLAGYRPDPASGWLAAAHELQRRLGEDLDHRDVSPSWLLRELATRTGTLDAAVPVVFTSALGVGDQATPVSMDMSPGFPERAFGISQSPQVSLDNQVLESAGGLQVTWDAVEELFHAGVLDAMLDAYHLLLEHLATADWHAPLPELLPPAQRAVRERVNATDADLPAGLLHAPFLDGAAARPDAPALLAEGVAVTHGELADRALRVAAGLVERGVQPGDAVTVTLPKGPEQAVAVLGVLAAGAAYVPIGVDQPPRRRAQVHQAARARAAITDLGPLLAAEPLAGPVAVSADAPAYVIFTSGSTGTPKGVQVRHSAAANTVADVTARFGIGPADRVLGVSALDFDLSVYDLFGLLGAGGAVVFPAEDERRDATRWRDLAQAHGVTVWNSVPVLLEMLLVAGLPSTLRLALVSGDWVPVDLPGRAAAAGIRLIAMGGATEGAIWSNAVDATALPTGWAAGRDGGAWGSVPYGIPLANQRYRVVGDDGRDRPDWVPGELWIGGRGVADGYRGDPDRTAERFVTRDGLRWYRTGDVGRYRPDGMLEFLGRADQQVKIGGHRLELGEVETALAEHPSIDRAAVVAVGPRRARRLHAFLVGDPGPDGDLDAFLTERLPAHAVPTRRTVLDALPLTANGKIDRAELATRAEADGVETGAAPDGELEIGIARLWTELLELPAAPLPARDVAFFALGGSSLTTLRLLAAVSERFAAEIPARRFLAAPTVAALAADVRTAIADADADARRGDRHRMNVAELIDDLESSGIRLWALHEPVLARAAAHPDDVAVVDVTGPTTYGELAARASAVAALLRARDVEPGELVAVLMDKGVEQVVGALGVLLAGGAYLPIEPNQPAARRNAIVDDGRVRVALTQSWLVDAVRDGSPELTLVPVDTLPPISAAPEPVATAPGDLAYVIYTSGSTGSPKGVMISHEAALNTVVDVTVRFAVGPADRVLGLAALGFDLSVYDVFGTLAAGGTLVLPDPARRGDPSHWAELVAEHGVTVWNSVPGQLQMLHDHLPPGAGAGLASLRVAMLSGDWIPVTLPDQVRALVPGVAVHSLGGATEGAIWSIHHPVGEVDPAWPSIPYGTPMANQTLRALDHRLRPCPDWVVGELYIGGTGVALGYRGDPERTAERFGVHPRTSERIYRTGDLGRHIGAGDARGQGVLEFLGREDTQVKIRGYRIELAEVEAALHTHDDVATAAVLVDSDTFSGHRLAAFVAPARITPPAPDTRPADAARAAGEPLPEERAQRLRAFTADLDEAALDAMAATLRAALADGPRTAEQVCAAVNAVPRHHRIVRRWLRALVAAGRLTRTAAGAYTDLSGSGAPRWDDLAAAERELGWSADLLDHVRACAAALPGLLDGSVPIAGLLFPGAPADAVRAAYRDNLAVRGLNAAAAAAVAELARTRTGGPLRVLEIGAGVGAATAELVPALAGLDVEYLVTDPSPFFVAEARERFTDHPWVRHARLDHDGDLRAQGMAPHGVDVIVAGNALHRCTDLPAVLGRLTELLTPGGRIVLVEQTRDDSPALMTSMEFLEALAGEPVDGRRATDGVFVDADGWTALLDAAGARTELVLPEPGTALAGLGQRLVSAVVKEDRARADVGVLTRHLADRLPEYMIPAHWQVLDALPHTANGKVDRAALHALLPSGETTEPVTGSGEPRDDRERELATLWAELLDRDRVGRDEDFFALGGDSLLVARLVGRLRESDPALVEIEWDVVLRHLLHRPTVAGLAEYLAGLDGAGSAATEPAGPVSPVVPLNGPDAADVTTVLVHAGVGTIMPYRALVTEIRRRAAGKGRLVGIEVPDLDAFLDAEPAGLIERMAAEYARALLATGEQRFHVVGYCLGGLVATEVARTLTEAGADVASFTAISSHAPAFRLEDELLSEYSFAVMMGIDAVSLGFPADAQLFTAAAQEVLAHSPGVMPDGAIAALGGEYEEVSACFRRLAGVPRAQRVSRMCDAVPPSVGTFTPAQLLRMFRTFRQSVFAITRYRADPYAGDVAFLRHAGPYPFPGSRSSVTRYWEELTLGDLTVTDIGGDHFTCLGDDHVPSILGHLVDLTDGEVLA